LAKKYGRFDSPDFAAKVVQIRDICKGNDIGNVVYGVIIRKSTLNSCNIQEFALSLPNEAVVDRLE